MQTQAQTSPQNQKPDLLTAMANAGLPDEQALYLATHWPQADPDEFLDGLRTIATMLDTKQKVGKPPKCAPYDYIYAEIQAAANVDNGFDQALKAWTYDDEIQYYLIISVTAMMHIESLKYQGVKSGRKMSPGRAQRLTINQYLSPPSPALVATMAATLTDKSMASLESKQAAELVLLEWLNQHGHFARHDGYLFYLYADTHKLYELNTDTWSAWLHALTGLNPASTDWSYMNAVCISAATLSNDDTKIVKLAYWDRDNGTLRVSRMDGRVYVLDGSTIAEELNGEGPVLFKDLSFWESVEPDYDSAEAAFDEPFHTALWEDQRKWSWAAQVWLLSLFFTEMCPTRPIAVFLGEKGSGKSMALRMYLRLLFGKFAELTGVPEKPDQLQVAAHHNHILAMDNFDGFNDWMRDKLASLATGIEDQARTLYTNTNMTRITYRCWVAVTARTPDTLKRDDLADRLLILPLQRIPDGSRIREDAFLTEINTQRAKWWGGLLLMLNKIVATLNAGGVPDIMSLRMADWESFGQMASRATGRDAVWVDIVTALKKNQGDFLAADSIVVEAIDAWLQSATNRSRAIKARELYIECAQALFPSSTPDSDWPRSIVSFSKRLANISEFLKAEYGLQSWLDRTRVTWYEFRKKP